MQPPPADLLVVDRGGHRIWLEAPDVTPPLRPARPATRPAAPDDADFPTVVAPEAPAAFEALYLRSRTDLARALTFAVGDRDLAVEAVDEAFARAYERWATVSQIDRPEGWVYRVASNWALSVLRRRRRGHHRFYDPTGERTPDGGITVGDPAVEAALAELNPKHRSVVVCRHLLGWSVEETASALGIRPGTVKSRLHRAHHVLKSHLAPLKEQS